MKKLLTIALITLCGSAFAQKEIPLSKYESFKVAEQKKLQSQFGEYVKFVRKADSTYNVFLRDLLATNGIDLKKVSGHADSLKIEGDKIKLILKK